MFCTRRGVIFLLLSLLILSIPLFDGEHQLAIAKKNEGNPLRLIMATYIPTQAYKDLGGPVMSFANYLNEHGKENVHIEFYQSGTLLQAGELLPGLMQGTADIVLQTSSYISSTYPILGILELPFLFKDPSSAQEKVVIGSPLYALINRELAKKNLFMVAALGVLPEYLWTKDKPIRSPEDLKGLRIRTPGRIEAMVVKALGGASTTLPSPEVYEALSRGTIDGVLSYLGTIWARNLQDKVTYVNKNTFASYGGVILLRLDKWNSLPPHIQNVFIDAGKHFEKQIIEFTFPYWKNNMWPLFRKAGIQEITLTEEEEKAFYQKTRPVWDWWKSQLPSGVGEEAIRLATE